jgi:RNA polymerase sigma-70 factor, ECF subfamily
MNGNELIAAGQRARSMLLKLAGGRSEIDTEEIVAAAVAKAFEKRAQFRGDSSLSTWVTSIAIRIFYMSLRKHRAHVFVQADLLDVMRDHRPNREVGAQQTRQKAILVQEILRLPSGMRRAVLRISAGEKAESAGEKASRFRARHHLRRALNGRPDFQR